MDLLKVKKGITHAGKFHTDDVLSTVLLQTLNPNIKIIRVNQYDANDIDQSEISFDIGLGKFDHHQENREVYDYGYPYSAFGKLWREFGKECLKKYGFTKIDEAFLIFNRTYVSRIDQGDNEGYQNVEPKFYENDLIMNFNPSWFELKNNPNASNEQFFKVVEFAKALFNNWMRQLYEQIELIDVEESIWNKAINNEKDGIIVLDERIPWQTFAKKNKDNNVKMVVSKNERGGYSVISKNSYLFKIRKCQYLSFVHPSNFMGVANTLENAISAAKYSLNLCFVD